MSQIIEDYIIDYCYYDKEPLDLVINSAMKENSGANKAEIIDSLYNLVLNNKVSVYIYDGHTYNKMTLKSNEIKSLLSSKETPDIFLYTVASPPS